MTQKHKKTKRTLAIVMVVLNCFFSNAAFAQNELWGMTSTGGQVDVGTIFKTDASGNNQTVQNSFSKSDGAGPLYGHLIQAADGYQYGLTSYGGANNMGVLFQYNTATNTFTKKLDFDGSTMGSHPRSSLMQAADGNLYGMTCEGGAKNKGVLFQYNPTNNTYIKKLEFDGGANGRSPYGSLIQAADGNLYGMTNSGGANNMGVLFQYNPTTNTFTKKLDFDGSFNGSNPFGSLLQAADGNLYGMTPAGGTNNMGVLFQYNPATNTFTKKLDFDGSTIGRNPYGSLMQAADGNLYGMTHYGGAINLGVLFQYNPATNTCIKKLSFGGGLKGSLPYGSLMQAVDGKLYGMTSKGGASNDGVFFQYHPATNTITTKYDFDVANGRDPRGSLMQAADGNLYGMTSGGGANYYSGVLFQYNPTTNTFTKKLDFGGSFNGSNPYGSLLQATDGNLYGITPAGGANNLGVLFQYNPATNTFTKKLDFDGSTIGRNPYGSLMQASDGNLYGMTYSGGAYNMGVLFQYNPNSNAFTKKLDFDAFYKGGGPLGSLMQASDGNLYGMTVGGGANNSKGVLFQYKPATNTFTKKLDFGGSTNGRNPYGSLMQASDGNLYGMTYAGGANDMGALFQYNPTTNTCFKKLDFDGANGSNPTGSLMQATDGNLYGMTPAGGANNLGVLFQYNPATNTFTKKLDFDGSTIGRNPYGSLMQASDGNLYGMTYSGGAYNMGVLFQYNPATNTYTKKLDYSGSNGGYPRGNLIEVNNCSDLIGGLTANCITASSANAKWDTVTCAVGYKFQYKIAGATAWTTLNYSLSNTRKKLSGLLAATTYEWRVKSKLADGTYSANSSIASFTTLALRSGLEMIDNTSDLVVYPNPAADQLTLEFPFTEGVSTKITVVNTIGQTVLEQNVSDDLSTIQLNIQSLTKGLYVVTVINGDNTFNTRFIKK